MPKQPKQLRTALLEQGLTDSNVDVLMNIDTTLDIPTDGAANDQKTAVNYVTRLLQAPDSKRNPQHAFNWLVELHFSFTRLLTILNNGRVAHELLGQLTARGQKFKDNTITPKHMGQLLDLLSAGRLTGEAPCLNTAR